MLTYEQQSNKFSKEWSQISHLVTEVSDPNTTELLPACQLTNRVTLSELCKSLRAVDDVYVKIGILRLAFYKTQQSNAVECRH